MSSYQRPIKQARYAKPHYVSTVQGKTWGQRMSDQQKFKKSMRRDPVEYFAEQHIMHADTTQAMQTMDEGLAQNKTYYMNTPEDSRFKAQLHELGRYQRPAIEGMYNQHEELQEGTSEMMAKRIKYGLS
jgi:hypothetical protein